MENKKLLLVDDDESLRSTLCEILELAGYDVTTAPNVPEALRYITSNVYDVLLSDLQMPGTCGEDLALALREACGPHVALIAMTATIKQDEPEYDALLQKPVDAEAVRNVLKGRSEKAAGETGAPDLSEVVYGKMTATMRPEQVQSLYTFALDDADKRVQKLRSFAEKGQDAELRTEAHALKGSAAMIGALRLQSLASGLEAVGTSLDTSATIEQIVTAIARLRSILAERSHSS